MDWNFPDLIRSAIASGELEKALSLWDDYSRWLGEQLDRHLLPEKYIREAGELVEWARQSMLAQKAHMRDGLNDLATSVHVEQAYVAPSAAWRGGYLSFLA